MKKLYEISIYRDTERERLTMQREAVSLCQCMVELYTSEYALLKGATTKIEIYEVERT